MGCLESGQPAAAGLSVLVWLLALGSGARREKMKHREAEDLCPLPGMVQIPKRALWAADQQG